MSFKPWKFLTRRRPSVSYSLDHTERLINQGRWPRARRILRSPSFEQKHGGGASTAKKRDEKVWVAYCFQRALAELLTDGSAHGRAIARRYRDYAKASPAYTSELDGDFTRDVALACIRGGLLEEALLLIEEAGLNHETPNRKALMESVRARWNVAKGNLGEAEEGFQKAHKQWAEMGAAEDEQWVMNSLYHWFKFRASRGDIDGEMAERIHKHDPSPPRRFSVWLICGSAKAANRLDNSLQRFALRAMRLWR